MMFDGKKRAQEIIDELKQQIKKTGSRTLGVVLVGDDPISQRYVRKKQQLGEKIGIGFNLIHLEKDTSQEEVICSINEMGRDEDVQGIIVQLPLPKSFDTEKVLEHVPPEKDIDALSSHSNFYSPIVEVVKDILHMNTIGLAGKNIVVIGNGKLVGQPVSKWLIEEGMQATVIDIDTKNPQDITQEADIIISGAGVSYLVQPDMIKEGVVIVDAGTSEAEGKLVGDVDPACYEKASLYTPVPGGVGPMTVVMLFKNLLKTDGTN